MILRKDIKRETQPLSKNENWHLGLVIEHLVFGVHKNLGLAFFDDSEIVQIRNQRFSSLLRYLFMFGLLRKGRHFTGQQQLQEIRGCCNWKPPLQVKNSGEQGEQWHESGKRYICTSSLNPSSLRKTSLMPKI